MVILFCKFLLKNSTQKKNRVNQNVANGRCYEIETKKSETHSGGVNCLKIWPFQGFFTKYRKNAHFVRQFIPLKMRLQILFCFHPVAISIGYVVVYSIFSVSAFLEEKFVKQNGLFKEFLYSNVLVKYYRIQWIVEEKIFLKKPPLLAVSFKFMT